MSSTPQLDKIGRNQHEDEIVADLSVMSISDGYGFWSRALALATLGIWRNLRTELTAAQSALASKEAEHQEEIAKWKSDQESDIESIDALRRVLAELRAELEACRAELEACRRDAERYRWLRDVGDKTWNSMASRVKEGAAGIDKAIDAAIGAMKGGEQG